MKNNIVYNNQEDFLQFLSSKVIKQNIEKAKGGISEIIARYMVNCSQSLQNNKSFILSLVSNYPEALEIIQEQFKSDYDIVYEAVSRNGEVLAFAHESFKDNREFITKAIIRESDSWQVKNYCKLYKAFPFISEALRSDKDFVLLFLNQSFNISLNELVFIPDNLLGDKDIIKKITKTCPSFAQYISEDLKIDKQFVMSLISQDHYIFKYIEENLKHDREIIKLTIKHTPFMLKESWYIDKLNDDKELVLLSFNNAPHIFNTVSERLKKDKDVILAGVKRWGENIKYVDENLIDEEIILAALNQNCRNAYEYLPEKYKHNRNIIIQCLENNPYLLWEAEESIKNDKKIVLNFLASRHYEKIDGFSLNGHIGEELSKELIKNSNISSGNDIYEHYKKYLQMALLKEKLENYAEDIKVHYKNRKKI